MERNFDNSSSASKLAFHPQMAAVDCARSRILRSPKCPARDDWPPEEYWPSSLSVRHTRKESRCSPQSSPNRQWWKVLDRSENTPRFDTHEILVGNDFDLTVIVSEREDARSRAYRLFQSSREQPTFQPRAILLPLIGLCGLLLLE